jgi:hypothetical protein
VEEEDRSHVCVEDGVQVVASVSKAGEGSSVSHSGPWRGTYRINFGDTAGTEQDAFSQNHFNLSTKILTLQTPN